MNFEEFEKNFDFNNAGQTNFVNFYKKKEMEKLDMQIKQIISDIIEINTDSLNSIINEILSDSRRDILRKSWGTNNKKLLLFEIHRNYTSLVDKIYIFNMKSVDNTHPHTTRNTFAYKKKPSIDFNNSQNRILIEDQKNINNRNNMKKKEGDDYRKKIKEEILEFKKITNKIIDNFFDLSGTQISGDSIRDWLYENSKY